MIFFVNGSVSVSQLCISLAQDNIPCFASVNYSVFKETGLCSLHSIESKESPLELWDLSLNLPLIGLINSTCIHPGVHNRNWKSLSFLFPNHDTQFISKLCWAYLLKMSHICTLHSVFAAPTSSTYSIPSFSLLLKNSLHLNWPLLLLCYSSTHFLYYSSSLFHPPFFYQIVIVYVPWLCAFLRYYFLMHLLFILLFST